MVCSCPLYWSDRVGFSLSNQSNQIGRIGHSTFRSISSRLRSRYRNRTPSDLESMLLATHDCICVAVLATNSQQHTALSVTFIWHMTYVHRATKTATAAEANILDRQHVLNKDCDGCERPRTRDGSFRKAKRLLVARERADTGRLYKL